MTYESKVQSILCRTLNVRVRNMGFAPQAVGSDSGKKKFECNRLGILF